MFQVTTLDLDRVAKSGEVDYSKDFFGKKTNLTVSGQLEGELVLPWVLSTPSVLRSVQRTPTRRAISLSSG